MAASTSMQAMTLPSSLPPLPSSLSVSVEKSSPIAPTFTVQKQSGIIPQLFIVTPSGYREEIQLTPAEQAKLKQHVEDLLALPVIGSKVSAKTLESIKLTDLYLFIKGETTPLALTSDLPPIRSMRALCDEKRDPDRKYGGYSWPDRPSGARATLDASTPVAYLRPTSHLQNLAFTEQDEAYALDHWTPRAAPHDKLKRLKHRHAAVKLKEEWLDYLERLIQTTPKKEDKARIQQTHDYLSQEVWDFGLRFEMAHPVSAPAHLQNKEQRALTLIADPSKRPTGTGRLNHALHALKGSWGQEAPNPEAEKEIAKDLARAHIADHLQYKAASEALTSKMKRDPLQDAFAQLAKEIVDAADKPNRDALIDQALKSPQIQGLLNGSGPNADAEIKNRIGQILSKLAPITALSGATTLDQVQDFNRLVV